MARRAGLQGLTPRYKRQGFHWSLYESSASIARDVVVVSPSPLQTPIEVKADVTFHTNVMCGTERWVP